jgi:uncharacterized protein YegL
LTVKNKACQKEVLMVKASIKKLPAYIRHYVKRVIGLKVHLEDAAQACSIKNPRKPQIHLPMSQESLGLFLGEEFVEKAPVELLFSIVIGLAYHEAAHLMSGEKNVKPHLLDNIICDSNDFNYVPEAWKGSMPFTISLVNTTYRRGMDLEDIPLGTREDKLQALIHLAISYLRKLRVRHDGKDKRRLPEDHPLSEYFERIKPIMREARKAPVTERPRLVKELHDVLRDFWDENSDKGENGDDQSLEEALEGAGSEVTIELTAEDLRRLTRELKNSGSLGRIAGELKRVVISVAAVEAAEEKRREDQAVKRLKELGNQGSRISTEEPETPGEPVVANRDIARKLRRALKPLLCERSIARRKPVVIGSRFAPSRFHEIMTRPKEPRLRKDVLRTGRAEVETEIILCFDRSGSMSGSKEEVTKEVAATFHEALKTVTQARLSILGFDTEVTLIKNNDRASGKDIPARIGSGLSARGGTDFPQALYESLMLAEKSRAHRKLIIMLTDGDIHGSIDLDDLIRYARRLQVEIFTIGVIGSDSESLRQSLGTEQVLYLEDIHDLPEEIRRIAIRKA